MEIGVEVGDYHKLPTTAPKSTQCCSLQCLELGPLPYPVDPLTVPSIVIVSFLHIVMFLAMLTSWSISKDMEN